MNVSAQHWVDLLDLTAHPKGGYFKENYRSNKWVEKNAVADQNAEKQNFATAIYFLLTSNTFSPFHRIKSDEIWHFYEGSSLTIYVIETNGKLRTIRLGKYPTKDQVFQAVIPKDAWFAAKVDEEEGYVLAGVTVLPGFDFVDFELADKKKLINDYPQHEELISQLTK